MSVDLISTQPETNLTVSGFLFHHKSELKSSGFFSTNIKLLTLP